MDLFDEESGCNSFRRIDLPGAALQYFPNFFNSDRADEYLAALRNELEWRQEVIKMYGRDIDIPRLSAWYGEPEIAYSYSGIRSVATSWSRTLMLIKSEIENVAAISINSVLANLYRDGSDSVSWHADDEPELGESPIIASLSLGQTRTFQMKHKRDTQQKFQIDLMHGSLLIMSGDMQRNWLHQVPKTKRQVGERINLTYRYVY